MAITQTNLDSNLDGLEVKLKRCSKCKTVKQSKLDFYSYNKSKCKSCVKEAQKKYGKKFQVTKARKAVVRKFRYGINNDQYEGLFKRQLGCCALCKESFLGETPAVDHDHDTKVVRGLLHRKCNLLLGHADEDIHKLHLAVDYLELHSRVLWPKVS